MNTTQLWESMQKIANQYGPSVVKALGILVIGWIAARIITGIARRVMNRARLDTTLSGFLSNLVYALLVTLVVVSAIQEMGVPTTSFVAVIGAAGLAVGFALQGSLSNFAAGVMLIMFRHFRAGDFIEAGGVSGVVEELQVFATILKTPDNKRIIVPNSSMTNGSITNYSANPTRRVDLVFGISYGDDIAKAKKIIEEIVGGDVRILKDPAPTIAVLELADSSVNIACRPWVKTGDYWAVYFDLLEGIKRTFDGQGISIPFPQRDVHLHQVA